MKFTISVVVMALLCLVCSTTYGAADPNAGWRAWVLTGAQPEIGGRQEGRIGYEGLLPDVEFAIGGLHRDAPDDGVEDWSIRAYGIAHAVDTQMVASVIGHGLTLPDGNLYVGLFPEYTFDRDKEWSGGYIVGAIVDWPKGWQTVAEYESVIWNTDDDDYVFSIGLRRKF